MDNPELDLDNRKEIWNVMQMLYMDIDPNYELDGIAQICAKSKYSLKELELILFNEVFPGCRFNLLMLPAPEWCGFEIDWLAERILKKHRHGKRKLWFLRDYTNFWWQKLKPKVEKLRASS